MEDISACHIRTTSAEILMSAAHHQRATDMFGTFCSLSEITVILILWRGRGAAQDPLVLPRLLTVKIRTACGTVG